MLLHDHDSSRGTRSYYHYSTWSMLTRVSRSVIKSSRTSWVGHSQFVLGRTRLLVARQLEHQAWFEYSIFLWHLDIGRYQVRRSVSLLKVAGPAHSWPCLQLCCLARTDFSQNNEARWENCSRAPAGGRGHKPRSRTW